MTDSAVVGYGEAYALPFHPNVVEKLIADVCQRYVLGSDPLRIEWLWRQVYSSEYSQRAKAKTTTKSVVFRKVRPLAS